MTSQQEALIIFVRNPILGKVKTRIAATIGDEKALLVYKTLLQHTRNITGPLLATKFVFYADEVNNDDIWNGYTKKKQTGIDLGERMKNAFEFLCNAGFEKIVIIGSDCMELRTEDLANSFLTLTSTEIIIGPASDGGYYLLGMRSPLKNLFAGITWSTNTVLEATLEEINKQSYSSHLMHLLNDIDEEKDINFKY